MVDKTVHDLFSGFDDRYRIPIYQRRYVWGPTHWTHLWKDIKEKAKSIDSRGTSNPPGHFTGVIVTRRNEAGEVEIVDGQQRLTTFQIILCAIRNICEDRFPSDQDPRDILSLTNRLLKNSPQPLHEAEPERAYKLLPTEGVDRDDFRALVAGAPHGHDVGLIWKAYTHFKEEIEKVIEADTGKGYDQMHAISQTLCYYFKIVEIPLARGEESAKVFESLNGRGLPLAQFDLLRNYVFLRAGEQRNSFYDSHWRHFNNESFWLPIDITPTQSNTVVVADDFLENFLRVKLDKTYTLQSSLFDLYQHHYLNSLREQLNVAIDDHDNADLIAREFEELQKYSLAYVEIDRSDYNSHIFFHQYLKKHMRIASWYPLTLLLKTEPTLSEEQEKYIFRILESYIVRYILCYPEEQTWILESDFRKLNNEIIYKICQSDNSFKNIVKCILDVLTKPQNAWPNDKSSTVQQALCEAGFHWSNALIRHILFRIEYEQVNSELTEALWDIDYTKLTIEHIMPIGWKTAEEGEGEKRQKTWPITTAVEKEYSEEAHKRDLNVRSIGNLTLLTGKLNSTLADTKFNDKREQIKEHSILSLNADVISNETWDANEIKKREDRLIKKFRQIWWSSDSAEKNKP